jgi:hypothetical protein
MTETKSNQPRKEPIMRTKPNALDRLVDEVTAFRTWTEMRTAMDNGYCPTINSGKPHIKLTWIIRRNGSVRPAIGAVDLRDERPL